MLEAEIIRDITLSASGPAQPAGWWRAVFPSHPPFTEADQPRGTWELTKEDPPREAQVYAYVKRGLKYPMFEVFDET